VFNKKKKRKEIGYLPYLTA